MDIFCERLVDLREEHDYTQARVAEALNITTSAYGFYEQGINEPSLDIMKKIAEFYGISLDYLFGFIKTPNHPKLYSITEDLNLTASEIQLIQILQASSLLKELSTDPETNAERIKASWKFLQQELHRE